MSGEFVKLKTANLSFAGGGGGIGGAVYLNVSAKVKNVAYSKNVRIHYGEQGGAWQDLPLTWKNNYGNYDLFTLDPSLNIGGGTNIDFALSVSFGDEIYWDNNNFTNYSYPINFLLAPDNITLDRSNLVFGGTPGSSYVTGISGEILVKNAFYHKSVGIRFSSDQWMSYFDIGGVYDQPLGASVERWRFGLNTTPAGFARGQFAAYLRNRETGQSFWDNNFDQNYDMRQAYELG